MEEDRDGWIEEGTEGENEACFLRASGEEG